jgi:hypothetical protein
MTLRCPIAGNFFRRAGALVLGALPAGAPLRLVRQLDNPVDPLAVKVLVPFDSIPEATHEGLKTHLPGFGKDFEDLRSEEFMIGYVSSSDSEKGQARILEIGGHGTREIASLFKRFESETESEIPYLMGALSFSPTGLPEVLVSEEGGFQTSSGEAVLQEESDEELEDLDDEIPF